MSIEFNPRDADPHGEYRREIEKLRERLASVRSKIEDVVCTVGIDKGVVMLNMDSPTRPTLDLESGEPCRVYVHQYYSELGDALIELWEMTK